MFFLQNYKVIRRRRNVRELLENLLAEITAEKIIEQAGSTSNAITTEFILERYDYFLELIKLYENSNKERKAKINLKNKTEDILSLFEITTFLEKTETTLILMAFKDRYKELFKSYITRLNLPALFVIYTHLKTSREIVVEVAPRL